MHKQHCRDMTPLRRHAETPLLPCTTLCADRLLCPVVVLAVAAHPVTTFELDGRAVFIVAGVTEVEVAVTTCPAEPVGRINLPSSRILPSSTCDLCRVSSGTLETRLSVLRPCLTQCLCAHCDSTDAFSSLRGMWCQLFSMVGGADAETPQLRTWALTEPWIEWGHRPSITVMGIAILWWTQYLLKINAQLTKWTDRNVIIDVALCSFLAAPPALPNTPCENWWGQRIPAGSPKGGQGSNTMLWLDSWLEGPRAAKPVLSQQGWPSFWQGLRGHVENTGTPEPW